MNGGAAAAILDERGRLLLVREETSVDARIDDRNLPAVPEGDEIAEVGWFDPAAIPEPRSNLLHYALTDVVVGARGVERRDLDPIN